MRIIIVFWNLKSVQIGICVGDNAQYSVDNLSCLKNMGFLNFLYLLPFHLFAFQLNR